MKQLFVALFFLLAANYSIAQSCPVSVPAAGACPSQPEPTDGQTINSGSTLSHVGTDNFGNLNLSGGTLYVCGDLTLDNINFSGGNIIIQPTATLTINDNNIRLNGDVSILNYGTLNLNGNTTLQNADNSIVNAISGHINMPSNKRLEINSNSSSFTNLGTATMGELHLQSNNGGVCLGEGSETSLSELINNGNNSINGPSSGTACISVQDKTIMNSPLTADNSVSLCLANGIQQVGGSNYGAAQVNNDCSACGTLLARSPIYLSVTKYRDVAELQVRLETLPLLFERAPDKKLYLYKSADAYTWHKIDSLEGAAIQSFQNYRFDYGLQLEHSEALYFKASLERTAQQESYASELVYLALEQQRALRILRHSNRTLEIRLLADVQIEFIKLFSYLGRLELQQTVRQQQVQLNMQSLPEGIHIIHLQLSDGSRITRRVLL